MAILRLAFDWHFNSIHNRKWRLLKNIIDVCQIYRYKLLHIQYGIILKIIILPWINIEIKFFYSFIWGEIFWDKYYIEINNTLLKLTGEGWIGGGAPRPNYVRFFGSTFKFQIIRWDGQCLIETTNYLSGIKV